jgi:hypothetical protein
MKMKDNGRAVCGASDDGLSNISTLGLNSSSSKSIGMGQVPDQDLVNYMADILLELEEMAVFKQWDGVADLLGCAHRAIQRNQK